MSGLIGQVGARSGVVGSGTDSTQLEYEEGSWTPTMLGQGSEPTQSYHHQVGRYIKIGRVCIAQCNVEFATGGVSAGSGNLRIAGFPFNFSSISLNTASGVVSRQGGISTTGPNAIAGIGGDSQANCTFVTTTTTNFASAAHVTNGSFIYATICYQVD